MSQAPHPLHGTHVEMHGLDPERQLIAAILRQALLDAQGPRTHVTSPTARRAVQQDAREFLQDLERLSWFCELASIELDAFQRLAGLYLGL